MIVDVIVLSFFVGRFGCPYRFEQFKVGHLFDSVGRKLPGVFGQVQHGSFVPRKWNVGVGLYLQVASSMPIPSEVSRTSREP